MTGAVAGDPSVAIGTLTTAVFSLHLHDRLAAVVAPDQDTPPSCMADFHPGCGFGFRAVQTPGILPWFPRGNEPPAVGF